MISLKRYIEAQPEELLKAMCASYRTSLTEMGTGATQICPHIGEDFQRGLLNLRDRLSPDADSGVVAETGRQIEEELRKWGASASKYFRQTAHDIKDMMLLVAETTQAMGDRDQRYASQFAEFAGQLAAIGNLEDLTKIRQSLGKRAQELKSCVERMVQDGEQSVSRLRAELNAYQVRLDEVERVATQDSVTGVASRYMAERQIHLRVQHGRSFSVAMFDLDDFKRINDHYGHLAGDCLLKQFATELRAFFRPTDIVSRWGGDEFMVIVDCSAEEVKDQIEPVRRWVDGDYKIEYDGQVRKVTIQAAVGIASWRPAEATDQLIARADAAMYEEKARRKRASNKAG